jgi:uncharacterized protein YjfI (DUF2170 family)
MIYRSISQIFKDMRKNIYKLFLIKTQQSSNATVLLHVVKLSRNVLKISSIEQSSSREAQR